MLSGPPPCALPYPSEILLHREAHQKKKAARLVVWPYMDNGECLADAESEDDDSSDESDSDDTKLIGALSCDDTHGFSRTATRLGMMPLRLASVPARLLPTGRAARGWTWLHMAAAQGSPGILQWLLSPGVLRISSVASALDHKSGDGRTALLIAAEHRHGARGGDCAALSGLLRAGACAYTPRKPDGLTAAHLVCSVGCASCLRLLLQRAPQLVDASCRARGEQPLHVAARAGSCDCVSELCMLGARVDSHTREVQPVASSSQLSPLHLAASSGSRRTVRQLLELRATVTARDAASHTPLHHALRSGSSRVVAELMAHGADPRSFSVALRAALKAVAQSSLSRGDGRSSAASRRGQSGDIGDSGEDAEAMDAALRKWSKLLSVLAVGGAPVRGPDLQLLRLGWSESFVKPDTSAQEEPAGAAMGGSAGDGSGSARSSGGGGDRSSGRSGSGSVASSSSSSSGGSASGHGGRRDHSSSKSSRPVPSLRLLCQRVAANSLSAETVLPTLHMAGLLSARRLQHECERMVLQNAPALSEAGAFKAVGVRTKTAVRRLLMNALSRLAVKDACAGYDYFAELDLWAPRQAREEVGVCTSASDESSSSEEKSESEEAEAG